MSAYKFDTSGGPKWCIPIFAKLTTFLESISNQISNLDEKLCNKLDEVTNSLQADIQSANKKADLALERAQSNEAAIDKLRAELHSMNRKCNGLEADNIRLTTQCDAQESYSRRENLLIRGILEDPNETEESCITSVRCFLVNKMKLDKDTVEKMVLVRCHRVGRSAPSSTFNRPVIVRFHDFNDRKLVWNKKFDITDNYASVNENFANNIEYRRRLLYPIVKKANKSPKYTKVYIRGDTLVLDNMEYVFDEIHKLPSTSSTV